MYTHPVIGRLQSAPTIIRHFYNIRFIHIIIDICLACQSCITTNIHSSSGQSTHKSYDNICAFSDTTTFQSMYSMKQICLIFPIILGFSFSSIVFCRCFFVFLQGYMIYFMIFESFSHFTLFAVYVTLLSALCSVFQFFLRLPWLRRKCLNIPLQIFAAAENKRFRLRSVSSGARFPFRICTSFF